MYFGAADQKEIQLNFYEWHVVREKLCGSQKKNQLQRFQLFGLSCVKSFDELRRLKIWQNANFYS